MAKSGMSDVDSEEDEQGNPEPVSETNSCSTEAEIIPAANGYKLLNCIRPSTNISILIESLVKNLCGIYEPDEAKSNQIYELICDKLHEMKMIDESYNMTEFEGMRNQYQRALYHLVTAARGGEPPAAVALWNNNDVSNEWSHYYREFDEMEFIAGGGFGQVFRVKHKLDSTEYAVKKIYIRSDGIKSVMDYLSEVKTFASLNHANIVQYKAAWLELAAPNDKHVITDADCDSEYSTNTNTDPHSHMEDDYIYPDHEDEELTRRIGDDTSDFVISFKEASKQYSLSSNNGTVQKYRRTKRSSISEGGNAICRVEEIRNLQVEMRQSTRWATLYIQMSLCQLTLKQWLEVRNSARQNMDGSGTALVPHNLSKVEADTVMEILKQLLRGIQYIHYKSIVHHDIKPSNIFIQMDEGQLLVQLGDFGLACPLQSARHSLAFGTKLYAAPEQLAGKCDPKSDMYSLGIVLLELVETFNTDMERVQTINELRKGHLPLYIPDEHPRIAATITQLVTRYAKDRPDATTLLQQITVNNSESVVVKELREKLAEKEQEIQRLKELLKTAGVGNV